MINVHAAFNERSLKAPCFSRFMTNLYLSSSEEMDEVKKLVKEIMEGVWRLKVPLRVNIACGKIGRRRTKAATR
jgi:DNA polymerase I-like protein with 3'-5' exonuclease and polymerase domains